jgi:hypothetical protein
MSEITTTPTVDRFCPECGYDLRGLASERCPECGLAIDAASSTSPIPWSHRARIGRLRAFRRTVILATFQPKKLAAATAVPVDFRDAVLFRRLVVIQTALPIIAAAVCVFHWMNGFNFLSLAPNPQAGWPPAPSKWLDEPVFCWSAGAMLPPVLPIGILLSIAIITAAPSYWFHPRQVPLVRQNRAVAVSAYLCAPLVLLEILLLVGGVSLALFKIDGIEQSAIFLVLWLLYLVGVIGSVVLLLLMWWNTLRVMSRTTHASAGRLAAAGVLIPLSAIVAIIIGVGVFPVFAGFIWLMIDSVR